MRIEGTRAVVTGGTSGIGRALGTALTEAGATVLTCGSNEEKVAALRAEHPRMDALCCDVTEPEDGYALREAVDSRLGGLDLLVHCAGVQRSLDLTEPLDMAEVEREIAVNLVAPIRLTDLLLPRLLASERPAIVVVTSILALSPKESAPVYCASKAGLASWTTSLRYRLEPRGVLVMELVPPVVATPMTEGRQDGAIEPSVVAEACVDGLRGDKTRVLVGKARLAHAIHRVAPAVLARSLRHA